MFNVNLRKSSTESLSWFSPKAKTQQNTVYAIGKTTETTVYLKNNVPRLTGYRFNTHPPIFTIFGTRHQQRFKNWLQV